MTAARAIALVLWALRVLAAEAPPASTWADDVREARRLYDDAQGPADYQQAIALFEQALSKDPPARRVPELHYWLGRARYDGKDAPGALAALRKATASDPRSPTYRLWLAYALHGDGRTTSAVRALRSVFVDPLSEPAERQSAREWLASLHEPVELAELAPSETLTVPGAVIRHGRGDPLAALARECLADARARLFEVTGLRIDEPAVEVYLFPSAEAYHAYHQTRGAPRPRWSTACTAYGRVYVSPAAGQGRDSLTSTLSHEYTHVALRAAADDRPLPCWLDEGLAVLVSGQFAGHRALVARAPALLSLAALQVASFGAYREEDAALAYAQSKAMVEDLLQTHGAAKLRLYLAGLGRGAAPDELFGQCFGLSAAAWYDWWSRERSRG